MSSHRTSAASEPEPRREPARVAADADAPGDRRWLLEQALEGVACFDARGVCVWANPALRAMLRIPAEGAGLSARWLELVNDSDRGQLERAARELASEGRFEGELRCKRLDGNPFVGRVRARVVPEGFGEGVVTVAFLEDLTDWYEITAALECQAVALERSNEDLEQFAYIAAHDLQEPARKLLAFSQLLREDLGEALPEAAARDLGFIEDAAQRLKTLVLALLDLSRASRAPIRRERLAMDACVDFALEGLEARVRECGARIARDPLPEVTGDRTLLAQVWHNLISNALKFRSEAPELRFTAERAEDGRWILGLRDNGIGVEPQYAGRIFEPFRRLHGRDRYEGTGIGLSICRRVVERHGGRIWMESEPGVGSHVRFTLAEEARG